MQYIVYCLSLAPPGQGWVCWLDPRLCWTESSFTYSTLSIVCLWHHQGKGGRGDRTQGCAGQNPASHAVHCLLSVFGTTRARVGVVTGPKAVLDRIQLHMQYIIVYCLSGTTRARVGVVTGPKAVLDRIQLHMQASVMHASGVAQVRSGSPFCSLCYYCLSVWLFCSLLSPVSFYNFFIVLSPCGNYQLTWR